MITPIFSTVSNVITIMLLNLGIIIVSPLNLLFPFFLHHHCLQILYNTNFLRENVFYTLLIIRDLAGRPDRPGLSCRPAGHRPDPGLTFGKQVLKLQKI